MKGFGVRYNILGLNQQGRDHAVDQSVVEVIIFKDLKEIGCEDYDWTKLS
jgi:hypothetical protein